MPVPYTKEVVAALRHAERMHTSAEEMMAHLGWDEQMLARVCRKHEIDLVVVAASTAPPSPKSSADEVSIILSKLTSRQAQIFGVLLPLIDASGQWSDWVSGAYIARIIGVNKSNAIIRSVVGLDLRLSKMDTKYRVESRLGRGGGYRLVVDKGV